VLLAVVVVLLVAGLAIVLIADGTAANAAGLGLVGVAGVLATSAAFYAVGRSEDAERRRRERPPPPGRRSG